LFLPSEFAGEYEIRLTKNGRQLCYPPLDQAGAGLCN
jgi:hypothetical protein